MNFKKIWLFFIFLLLFYFLYARIHFVSGNVGMADELDSGSSVGYHVWVQVPFSAYRQNTEMSDHFCVFLFLIF